LEEFPPDLENTLLVQIQNANQSANIGVYNELLLLLEGANDHQRWTCDEGDE
jgi:hypothetical protein